MPEKPTIVLTNAGPGDVLFHNDLGSWNVTRALLDCKAGKHKLWHEDVEAAYSANSAIAFEHAKVEELLLLRPEDYAPLLAVIENGAIWLIDGRHRLEALHLRREKTFLWYVIEEKDSALYRVLYNGERRPPFRPY